MNRILSRILILIILLIGVIFILSYIDNYGVETFRSKGKGKSASTSKPAKAPPAAEPAKAAPASKSVSKSSSTSVTINMGSGSSRRGYGGGYGGGGYGGYRPTSLTGALAVAVINKNTTLLCSSDGRNCNYDNDCCSKNCKRHDIEGTPRSLRVCSPKGSV